MIRVVLLGRLGNNLFQHAAALALARRHGTGLRLDASWFNRAGWNQIRCIRELPISATVVRRASLASRALRRATGRHPWEFLGLPVDREPAGDQRFRTEVAALPADCLLMGYYQSPHYFAGHEDAVRREFDTTAVRWDDKVVAAAESMTSGRVAAVHVRRTDYLTLPQFDVCGMPYYESAMRRLRERVEGVRFAIFSDDPDWCRTRFRADDCRVIDPVGGPLDALAGLHLMSLADHHVIANSSFSWWAAWLGQKPGQQVLCPPRWYASDMLAPIGEKLLPGWEVVAESTTDNAAIPLDGGIPQRDPADVTPIATTKP